MAHAWTWTCAVLLLAQAVGGVLRANLGPPWEHGDDPFIEDDNNVLQQHGDECSQGVLACVRRDLAASLGHILALDQFNREFNVSSVLSVERVRFADQEVNLNRMATSLNEGGLPTLASTAIKVFETHALVWKLWPGMLHFKVFRDPDEGMDAALEVPPSDGSRTWGFGARRRLTMALLPIMYKMGVGTTLLGVLVFIGLKSMFMISILFVLAISSFAKHKLSALTQHYPGHYYAPPLPHKEVHVHVHADPHKQAYGGWHRHGAYGAHGVHGAHGAHYQEAYTPYHSAPPSDEGYYESEPTYYHRRRVGVAPALPAPAAPPAGYMVPLSSLSSLSSLASLGSHAPIVSRWDPTATGYMPEPDMYSH